MTILTNFDKYIFFITLFFIPFFSLFRVSFDNSTLILSLPYIMIGFIGLIFVIKNINYFTLIFLIFLLFINIYFFFFNNFINLNYFLIFNLVAYFFIFFNLYFQKINKNIMFIDYIFVFLFILGLLFSFNYNQNENLFEIINSLLNFRYYILNIVFFFFARLFIKTNRDLNIFITILVLTAILSILYNFFEINLITNSNNINDLEKYYLGLKTKEYFPHALINLNPFIISNYLPLGLQYNRLLSGYYYLILFIIISFYLFYLISKYKLNNIFTYSLYFLLSIISASIIWYSKSDFLIYLICVFILSVFLIFKKEIYKLIVLNFFSLILSFLIISYIGIFDFKKNILNEISYLIKPIVFLPADVSELYCEESDYCGIDKKSNFKFYINKNLNSINEKFIFKFKNLDSILSKKDEFELQIFFLPPETNSKYDELTLLLKPKENSFEIYLGKNAIAKCKIDNCINFEPNINKLDITNLSLDKLESSISFNLINNNKDLYFSIKDKYFFDNTISFELNNTEINILPKINSLYFNCSIDRQIYSQLYVDNSNCYKIPSNVTKITDINKYSVFLLDKNINKYNFINTITYSKEKTNVFYYFFKYLNIDIKKNSDIINKHGNLFTGFSMEKNNWYDQVVTFINSSDLTPIINKLPNNNTADTNKLIINNEKNNEDDTLKLDNNGSTDIEITNLDDLAKFNNPNAKFDLPEYQNLSTEADVPWVTFFYNYGILTILLFLALLLPILNEIRFFYFAEDFKHKIISFAIILVVFSSIIALIHITVLFKISIAYIIYSLVALSYNFHKIEKNV